MIIYKITNTVNGKVYIGQTTKRLDSRSREHFNLLNRGRHHNTPLQNSYNKYGRDSFKIEQIDTAGSLEDLNAKEVHFIQLSKSKVEEKGFNLMTGGNNSKHALETCEKISKSRMGKYTGKDNPMFGRKRPEVGERNKLLKTGTVSKLKGRPQSEEHRKKNSESHMGLILGKQSPERVANRIAKVTGQKRTLEQCKRIGKASKGRIPWSKGLKKEEMIKYRIAKIVERIK